MVKQLRIALLAILLISHTDTLQAQCSGGTLGKNIVPGLTWSSVNTNPVIGGRYYTFTAVAGATYYFSFCAADGGSSNYDTQITILNNTGGYAGGYNDDYCGLQSSLAWTCTTAGVYRCLVNKFSCATQAAMGIMVYRYQPPLSCPANLGTGTVNVTALPYASGAGTTCGAINNITSTNVTAVCGSSAYYNGEDKVFVFTPAITGTVTITLTAAAATYTGLMLYKGCPLTGQGGTCVDYNQSSTGSKSLTVCLQGGVTYYLILDSWPSPTCNPYTNLTISAPVASGGCALGTGGVTIASLPYTSTGRTTCGKVDDFTSTNSVTCGSGLYFGAEDETFVLTPTTSGQITITETSTSSWVGIMLYDGCPRVSSCSGTPGVCVANAQSSAGSQSMCVNVTAGHTYYLIIDQFPSPYCIPSYSINITAPVASLGGATCNNALLISSLPYSANNETTACTGNDYTNASTGSCATLYESGEDKVYKYVSTGSECITITLSQANNNNIGYQVYNGCPGTIGTTCIGNNGGATSGTLSGSVVLPAAGTYYIVVDSWAPPANVVYDISVQSFGTGATNDLPCSAQPLPLGVYMNGNNNCSGSANEPAAPTCWSTGSRNTVWFSFIAPTSGQVTIRTVAGSLKNTQIALYRSPCGATMTMDGCNDDAPSCGSTYNYMSQINISGLVGSATYYIAVDGYADLTGSFGIIVIDGPPSGLPPIYGQECSVPNPVCSQIISVGDPGYQVFGSTCDFPGGGTNCLLSGERGSAWYQIQIQNTGIFTFNLVPNDYPAAFVSDETDYDFAIWKMKDGPTNTVVNTCATMAAGAAPIRCDYSYLGVTGLFGAITDQAPPQYSPDFNASYDSQLPVSAGDIYLLVISNFENSTSGFTMDFLTSPINYQPNPGYVVWSGGVDNDWFKTANWGGCAIPTCAIDAIIPPSSANMPVISAAGAACKSITINPAASLTINSGFSLTVCQDYTNSGTLNAAITSTVIFNNGSVVQNVNGNLIGGSAFGNITVTKTGGLVNMNQNCDVKGNFTLSNATSNWNANGFTHRVAGHFMSYGAYAPGTNGMLELFGSTPQNYYNTGLLNNLNMVHTSTGVTLLTHCTLGVAGLLNLVNGKIITNAFEVILNNRIVGAATPGSNASYVEGNLRRYINTLGSYNFPVGHSAKGFQRINLNFAYAGKPTAIDNLLARFDPFVGLPAPLNVTECGATYSMPALNNGYWTVIASNNFATGNYDATLNNQNFSNAGNGWTVMRKPGGNAWALVNGTCTPSPVTAVKRLNMTGFSTNGITLFGNAQSTSPLPVELLKFNASPLSKSIYISWTTASETNCKQFELQRSENGSDFNTIAIIPAKGNSFTLTDYSFDDKNVSYNKTYYYRLNQIDINGNSYLSEIKSAALTEDLSLFNVQPNPYKNETLISYTLNENTLVKLEVLNQLGQVVKTLVNESQLKGNYHFSFGAVREGLPAGIYNIKLTRNDVVLTKMAVEL